MLGKFFGRTLLVLGFALLTSPAFAAAGSYSLSVNEGSHLWINGDSTLHKYKIETSTFNLKSGSFNMSSPAIPDIKTLLNHISGDFVLTIPVESLKDPEPGFNGALYRNMKSKQYPDIVFSLNSATATPDPSVAGRYDVTANGTVTVAGVQNPETLSAVFDLQGNTLHITGSADLLMSDFGIKPPVMFFGTIKTFDKVTIPWDLSLSLR